MEGAVVKFVEVKSMGGSNFIRADLVVALQTSNGATVIVMEGGATVHSTEPPKAIAARIEAAAVRMVAEP
jgi:hypothetical protein